MTSNPPYNGVGRVFAIYINHRGGNIVHKHKTIQFDAVGEGPARHLFLDYLGTIDNNKSKRIKHGSRALFLPRKIFFKNLENYTVPIKHCVAYLYPFPPFINVQKTSEEAASTERFSMEDKLDFGTQ